MGFWAVRVAIALAFNAITLWVASVLPGVRIGAGFWWAVLAFTAASLLTLQLLNRPVSRPPLPVRGAACLVGGLGGLWMSSLVPGGVDLASAAAWAVAAAVMWGALVIQDFVDDGLEARAANLLGVRLPASRRRPR